MHITMNRIVPLVAAGAAAVAIAAAPTAAASHRHGRVKRAADPGQCPDRGLTGGVAVGVVSATELATVTTP